MEGCLLIEFLLETVAACLSWKRPPPQALFTALRPSWVAPPDPGPFSEWVVTGLPQCAHAEGGQVHFYPHTLKDTTASVFLVHWVHFPQILPGAEILWKYCLINIESRPYLVRRLLATAS